MTNQPKKMAVLSVLKAHDTDLSLLDLLALLGPDYSERTVRRWLAEMIANGQVIKTGKKRSTRYQIIESSEKKIPFNEDSLKSINYLSRPLFERTPVTYHAEWLDSYLPNKTSYLKKELLNQLHQLVDQNKKDLPAGTYARKIYNRLLIDLSYNSSRLEGNTYSLLDTERLILEGEGAPGKMDEEKIMILNHKEAIAYLINNAQKITTDFNTICTLHYLLSDGLVPVQYSGKIRNHGVRISGSTYVPWENPDKLKEQLQMICQKAFLINDPFEQSFFLITHLAYLQAFTDVNKRTSRLSANIPLIKHNLIPLSFNDISKNDYQTAMIAIYELNDINLLIELFSHSYKRTCQMYAVTLEAINYDEVRVRYRQQRRNIVSHIISHGLKAQAMKLYIFEEARKDIDAQDQVAFIEDVEEDLREISQERIAGLGITAEQLNAWLKQ